MLVRWQTLQEVEEVRCQFDRLFSDFTTVDQESNKGSRSCREIGGSGEKKTTQEIT